MRQCFLSIAFLLCFHILKAEDIKYRVSDIPASLLKDVNMIKRFEEDVFEVLSNKNSKRFYKYALTILNENADPYAGFSEYYDKFRQIESAEGRLYDADGRLLKKIKMKDMADESAVSNISLMDDNRIKTHNFYYKAYPYTIEYEVSITYAQTFSFPNWIPQEYYKLSVQQSSFTVIVPGDYNLRYKMFNYAGEPETAVEKNKKKYTWQVSQLLPIKKEFYSPGWNELTPMVSLAPTNFEMGGYKGSANTWQEFGMFVYALNKDRDILPENVKQKVRELTATLSTDKEKIETLYKFLQQNTRYISIQLGIGGWQPFDAAYVSKKGYGDCKALSNYMCSLLKEAGIKSYYALIKAGAYAHFLNEDFPSTQFNHAIVCVPLKQDTLWLECTSQAVSPGYMGAFTGNRKALIINENGGVLVSTPLYGMKENKQLRKIKSTLSTNGHLAMQMSTRYYGEEQDDLSDKLNSLTKDKIKKDLEDNLPLSTYVINDFAYQEKKGIIPEVQENLNMTVSNYATITGKRLFITPNILSREGSQITENKERKVDFVFSYEFYNEEDAEIEIPEGYEVESLPKETDIKNKFGRYLSSSKLEGNKIIYHRIREQYKGRFSSMEQTDILNYLSTIYKADRAKIVLVKKNS